jgi:hypothetical protein
MSGLEYELTVDFNHFRRDTLFRLVSNFPLPFDTENSAMLLWAFNIRSPRFNDELSVKRYVALCMAHTVKPFSLTSYLGNGLKVQDSLARIPDLSTILSEYVTDLYSKDGLTHALSFRGFSDLSEDSLRSFINNYDVAAANLPFTLPDEKVEGRKACIRVVQNSKTSSEGVCSLQLYVGKDFGLADDCSNAELFYWFSNFLGGSR